MGRIKDIGRTCFVYYIQFESSEVIASKEYIMNRYIIYDDLRTKIKVA